MATESELVFSHQANHNFSRILADLKRANLSISNRLRSIKDDADFVSDVAKAFDRPLIANERCGSWYINPASKGGSAYFKSTDGHAGQWNFSCRRLNLHLLPLIVENDGCIIVDSTRRGKTMPDALSKTVPIWCCVINRVLFPEALDRHALYTPPNVVSRSEHAQAEARIPEHVISLRALDLDIEALQRVISKPLRPIWVTQETSLLPIEEIFQDFHPVICCTSSRRVPGGEMSEGGYIQGAGDDTENWALGLTAPIFWKHAETLLSTLEIDLPDLVCMLVQKEKVESNMNTPVLVAPCLSVGALHAPEQPSSACNICFIPKTTIQSVWVKSPNLMEVGIGKQKLASRNLRSALPSICDFVHAYLTREQPDTETSPFEEKKQIFITCETGKDISVAVALALNCHFFDDAANYIPQAAAIEVNKNRIKTRLGRLMMAFPEANPSRTSLQSVKSFLMG